MTLALNDRVKETTTVTGTGTATLLGATTGFQSFAVIGNANTTYYCIADQGGANWEVGIGTYTASGTTLARTTVLASSNGGALTVFTVGVKDVFVTYPSEKGLWKDASGNAIGLGTPAAFVGTNITGTASGLTAGNVTTNANLTGAVTSSGNATSLGSFTSANLATALTDETGTGSAVFSDNASLLNPTYTGTLTGSTGILNIGSGQIYKDASGNVGIGTSSPAQKLDILSTTTTVAKLTGGTGSNQGSYLNVQGSWIGNYSALVGGTYNSDLTIIGSGGSNIWYQSPGAHIWNAGGVSEKMRIDSSGNVGIGTTSPGYKLHVRNDSASATNWIVSQNGTATGSFGSGFIGLIGTAGTNYFALYQTGNGDTVLSNSTSTGVIVFGTNAGERMRIDSSGNVGIGTTAPNASAILDAQSTTKGVRFPNMTTTQKTAVATPAAGLVVFDTTLAKLCVYSGVAWQTITSV